MHIAPSILATTAIHNCFINSPLVHLAIGFLDEALPGGRQTASQIAAYNNRREAQWGVSPRDRQAVLAAFQALMVDLAIGF
jgi:hypothetical protein